jgi:hypothetical protein
MILWISIWIYKSLEHRLWMRPPERPPERASLTSSVYSYLRWILTATSPTIFSSFYFTCSRDFIIGIMVLWYYGIMILWYYDIMSIKHRLWKRPPERAQRASLTSSVYSYLRSSYGGRSARGRVLLFLRRPHQPFIILSISLVREISLSVLWYYRYYDIIGIMN